MESSESLSYFPDNPTSEDEHVLWSFVSNLEEGLTSLSASFGETIDETSDALLDVLSPESERSENEDVELLNMDEDSRSVQRKRATLDDASDALSVLLKGGEALHRRGENLSRLENTTTRISEESRRMREDAARIRELKERGEFSNDSTCCGWFAH